MSLPEDYKPCRHCGQLTDSGVCSSECADALDRLKELGLDDGPDDDDEPEAA